MNMVIIGNPSVNGEEIKTIATELTESGINVRYPSSDTVEELSAIETFERIDWSNFVIAVPRDALNFDAATANYLAYAKHTKKPVLIFYN